MRYYLDTNILVFLLQDIEELSRDTRAIILDYENVLETSSVCVQELIHLSQIGKLDTRKNRIDSSAILESLRELGIKIVSVSASHLKCYSGLSLYDDHRDPFDRLIIAQAIADRIPLISSDHKFNEYIQDGLDFIYNQR